MYLQSDLLAVVGGPLLFHGFFNRRDGVGQGPFRSLNVSFLVGDDPNHVRKNRSIIKERTGSKHLVSAKQVHGDRVVAVEKVVGGEIELDVCDGLMTDDRGVGLMIQQADCQAVLLFDPARPAIAALHCGWRGSVCNIIGKGVEGMGKRYGSDPAKILAAISPSLGPCCAEFIHHRNELPKWFQEYQVKRNYFDFWNISVKQLIDCGLKKDSISTTKICTCCHPDYFSYRRAVKVGEPVTGRCCSIISLND